MPHRCAFGCADTDVVMHVFPNPDKFPERFKIWVDLVGDKLKTLSDNQIFIKKRICDIHFIQEHKNRNKRLNILAVPSLHLPDMTVTGSSETVNERNVDAPVPGTSTCSDITFTGSSEIVNEKCFDAPIPGNSTSSEITVAGFSNTVNKKRVDVLLPATSTSSGERHIVSATDVTKEHNYSVISRNMHMKKTLAKDVRVSLSHQILLRSTQTKIKYLRSEICRLRKEGKTFKSRLANAEKMSKIIAFQLLTKNIKRPAQLFLSMQQQSQKKPKGRRVYDADKSYGGLRLLHKLTEEHVMPVKINKMRVKSATQLFSHSVAVVTEHLTATGDLNEECRQLVDFTLLMDNLFDSMNVSTFAIPNGKII
ncbi:unnamed protein product [Colias eurytheme]|nr:unnamed protein product [Colias eurytheme]